MTKARLGNQNPTQSVILPYKKSLYKQAISNYEDSGRTAQEWQISLTKHIYAIEERNVQIQAEKKLIEQFEKIRTEDTKKILDFFFKKYKEAGYENDYIGFDFDKIIEEKIYRNKDIAFIKVNEIISELMKIHVRELRIYENENEEEEISVVYYQLVMEGEITTEDYSFIEIETSLYNIYII